MTRDSLFRSTIVPGKPGSGRLFDEELTAHDGPVTCLGMSFANEGERRAWFIEKLREKLKDPEFRKIEGFPVGSDEDILALSDPPYYTACPNPWLSEFIKEWDAEKLADHKPYHREPYATDVSEGKNDPIYNAHSYHTKVPHKAIMRYILHYTNPGDVVLDYFCGTGMTGVAAQLCEDDRVVRGLGYSVDRDGAVRSEVTDENGRKEILPFSQIGARKAILADLSPAATYIARNYNAPADIASLNQSANRIIDEVERECGWMYETSHSDGRTGKISYTVWSDVFSCSECAGEVVYWEAALDHVVGDVIDEFPCPNCGTKLTKKGADQVWVNKYDAVLKKVIRQAKQIPVLINYVVDGKKFKKTPDAHDLALIENIESSEIPCWVPVYQLPDGFNTRQPKLSHGLTHIHHFYTKRNIWILAEIWRRLEISEPRLPFLFTASQRALSKMASIAFSYFFHGGGGFVNAGTKGTLYISSTNPEVSVFHSLRARLSSLQFDYKAAFSNVIFETKSATSASNIENNSIDYAFIDPPFGSNINYSELNTLWEPWLGVMTNISSEAIENTTQKKGLNEYRKLMTLAFSEIYRVLKPGRWVTVEFSNTKASVWNNIQTALTEAGFVVANISALDKKQGSFKAYTTPTAVKQDLIISAYKPNGGFEDRFMREANTEEGVWDFVRTHLRYLPYTKLQGAEMQFIPERDPRILFDQVIAYYVRKGYLVPVATSQEFQAGLAQRFVERDGMYFLPEQAAQYDRAKMQYGVPGEHHNTTVVDDEQSAIVWLRARLKKTPQVYSDIQPAFMPMLSHLKPNERELLSLELLLGQNFLCHDGDGPVPEQIHAYLSSNWKELRNLSKDDPGLRAKARDRWYVPDPNKAGDLEKLRDKALLKEFDAYKEAKKKLKVFRLEAVRAGFRKAWADRDYATIVAVADKIPSSVLEEDPKLLMWYDQATTRIGGDA